LDEPVISPRGVLPYGVISMANRKHTIYDAATGRQHDILFTPLEEKARDREEQELLLSQEDRLKQDSIEKNLRFAGVQKLLKLGLTTAELDALLSP
jgi:hypothetical protein